MFSALFIMGVARVAIFAAGLVHGIYHRRVVQTGAFALTLVPSLVFLFANAGFALPTTVFHSAVLLATPSAALLVGMMFHPASLRADGWRLW